MKVVRGNQKPGWGKPCLGFFFAKNPVLPGYSKTGRSFRIYPERMQYRDMKTNGTRVVWVNRLGEQWEHNFGYRCTLSYARDWWRRSILECQGILSRDESRESQLHLLAVENFDGGDRWEPKAGNFQ